MASNFLKNLKDCLNDYRQTGSRGEQSLVRSRDLEEIIYHFEGLDSHLRYEDSNKRIVIESEQLHLLITAMWKNNGNNSDQILFVVMDTLRYLLQEQRKSELKRGPRLSNSVPDEIDFYEENKYLLKSRLKPLTGENP